MPLSLKIRASNMVPAGQILIMADYEHPEVSMFDFKWGPDGLTSEASVVPDGRIIYCRPEDEQRLLDALAVAQERPRWWEQWAVLQRFFGWVAANPDTDVIGAAEGIEDWLDEGRS